MGKLGGGSGTVKDICGCAVVKLQTHFAATLPFNICANLNQHVLTTFIIRHNFRFILYWSTLLNIDHLSPSYIALLVSNTLLFNPCISVFSWLARSAL